MQGIKDDGCGPEIGGDYHWKDFMPAVIFLLVCAAAFFAVRHFW